MSEDRVAADYMLRGIQNWGQPAKDRERATREFVEAAGFRFGSKEGSEWLKGVLQNLRRGEFYSEVDQLQAALAARK